jgi:hypothetical protein
MQPPNKGTGVSFQGVKRPGREAGQSPLTSAEVIQSYISLHGVVLN